MHWETTNLKRSYVCNRDLIKFFRERVGWSQQQLAKESGVSVRVISKAEAGESIASGSICRLAAALSDERQNVYPEDLISWPVKLCRNFMDTLHERKYRMTDVLDGMFESGAVFRITGDPKRVPFAGTHKGVRAYRRALKKFFQIFDYAPLFDYQNAYEYYPRGTDVVIWGIAQVRLNEGSGETIDLPHRQRLRFRRGKLYAFEDHYDAEQGAQFISAAVAIHGRKVYDPLEDTASDLRH